MKIRINDLARELEVKSKEILDALPEVGVKEKKTHSSSIEDHEADLVRRYFTAKSSSAGAREKSAPPEIKPKIDFSKVHKPGDVLRQLKEREEALHRPQVPPRPVTAAAPPVVAPKAPVKPAPAAPPPVQEKPAVIVPKAPAPPPPQPGEPVLVEVSGPVVIGPRTDIRVVEGEQTATRAPSVSYEDIGGLEREVARVREMVEQLTAHVAFHPGAHHMPLKVNEHGTQGMDTNQHQHERAHQIDVIERVRHIAF